MNRPGKARWGRAGVVAALLAVGGAAPLRAQEGVLTLEDAVAVAIERNQELEAGRLELAAAQARTREAWGEVFPRVDLTTGYTRNLDVPINFLPARLLDPTAPEGELVGVRFGTDNVWMNQLRIEQPLFQASVFIGLGAAERFRALQEEVLRGATHRVATRVRIAYFDVLLAEEALRLTEASLERVRRSLTETQALYRAGMVPEYDVLRLEVEAANLDPRARQARSRALAARRALAAELGVADGASLRVAGTLATLSAGGDAGEGDAPGNTALRAFLARPAPAEGGGAEAVSGTLAARSDLRQLELTRALRTAELRAERAAYLPKLSLWGTHTIMAQQDGGPAAFGGLSSTQRQMGLQLTMPLFSGMQRPARLQQRRAAVDEVAARLRFASAHAENEVRTLMEAVAEAADRVRAQELAVGLARRGWQIAAAHHREGLGGQLQVTDAENALRESEFNLAQAVYDHLVARARLDEATGEALR